MTVCIDSNVVLGMFITDHPHRPIHDAWFDGKFEWVVSNEIMLEYEEVVQRQAGQARAGKMLQIMELVGRLRGNVRRVSPTFRFAVIRDDPDDNKFVDAAIVANASYVITSDKHFRELGTSGYAMTAISPQDFIREVLPHL